MKKFIAGVLLGLFLGFSLVFVMAGTTRPRVEGYSGDGSIDIIGVPIVSPGYLVMFSAFDMHEEYASKFKVSGLPSARGWPEFGVRLHALNWEAFERLRSDTSWYIGGMGSLHLALTSSSGDVFFDVDEPIDEWIMTSGGRNSGVNVVELYFLSGGVSTGIDPMLIAGRDDLIFEVSYKPGSKPLEAMAEPFLRWGGFK